MGAPDLLHQLRGAGLVLTLTPTGDLHVAPRDALTDDRRAAIRAGRDALVLALQAEALHLPTPRCDDDPLLTAKQADDCQSEGRTHVEMQAFADRRARLIRWGWSATDAEAKAERLVRRDREGDDRRLCTECRNCQSGRYCAAYRAAGVGRELGELATMLQRCPAFASTEEPATSAPSAPSPAPSTTDRSAPKGLT